MVWYLCDDAPSFSLCDNPPTFHLTLCSEMEYDQQVIEKSQQLAYQGVLDNFKDVGITKAQLQEAQVPLKPSNRRPVLIDNEKMQKYLGNITVNIVQRTFKQTTQIGALTRSSHLQRQFKSTNPTLNLHCRNEADDIDQIFAKVPAMDGGLTSAHIFVGQDSKITYVQKSKNNSSAKFLEAFQDRVREKEVLTKLIADNAPIYRGWNATKYLRDLVISMW